MAYVLVTGATGFVGRNLVPALIEAGHKVRCAVTTKVSWLDAEQILINRLEDQKDWTQALLGIDTVIHLAAKVHQMHGNNASSASEYTKINTLAVKNLATQAAQHHIKRFIFLSTIKVNGEYTERGLPFVEADQPNPSDLYAQSKLNAEQSIQEIAQQTGMEFVILRPPLVYGPGVRANFLKMLQMLDKGWPLPFRSLQNRRSFIYIDNLVSVLCAVVEDQRAANQIYLVADDKALSLPQLLRYAAKGMKNSVLLFPVPAMVLNGLFYLFGLSNLKLRLLSSLEVSTDKVKSQLGWVPPITSLEGLEKTAQWYKHEFDS